MSALNFRVCGPGIAVFIEGPEGSFGKRASKAAYCDCSFANLKYLVDRLNDGSIPDSREPRTCLKFKSRETQSLFFFPVTSNP